MSSSYSPCAACKFLRRKCTQECVFAPYFPPDQPQRFANVHKVFGASNVSKLLNDLNPNQRQDAVNSLVYEAESRLHDPVYGCVGFISIMQKRLKHLQTQIYHAKKELATYIGPSAMLPMFPNPMGMGRNLMGLQGGPGQGVPVGPPQAHHPQQEVQQLLDAQQLAALAATVGAREEQEIMMSYLEQQQQQQQHLLFGGGGGGEEAYHHAGPSLGLGVTTYDVSNYHQIEQQQQQHDHEQHGEPLLLLQQLNTVIAPQQQQQQQQQDHEDEQKGPMLVLQQPDTVTLQQHGVGDPRQHMQLHQQGSGNMSHHHQLLLLHHNQQFQRSASEEEEEEDNTVGPSY